MAAEQENLANEVLNSFRNILSEEACTSIGEHNFEILRGMIIEAIDEHSQTLLEELEEMIKKLREQGVKRPIEL